MAKSQWGARLDADASGGDDATDANGGKDAPDERDSADDAAANGAPPESSAPPVGSRSPSSSAPSVADPGEIVLYNPETLVPPNRLPPNSNVIWRDTLTTEEQTRVVDAVFPGKH